MSAFFRRVVRRLYDAPYLLLSLTSLFWAINIVVGRAVNGAVPPVALAFYRWTGSFLLVIGFAWPHLKRDWPAIRAHPVVMLVLAFTGLGAYNAMAYWGLQYTQALNALLTQSAAPLLIALWSFVLFGDRLTGRQALGIVVSLVGVAVIVTHGDLRILLRVAVNRGDAWFLFALVFYALYSALLRLRPNIHPLSFLAATMGAAALLLLPAFLIEAASGGRTATSPGALLAIAYVIVFPSLLAYFCFNRGVELIGANRAGPFFHLIPLFGAVMAILFLGERPEPYHAAGFALVLGGVVLATRR